MTFADSKESPQREKSLQKSSSRLLGCLSVIDVYAKSSARRRIWSTRSASKLEQHHVTVRLAWAIERVSWGLKWGQVIFSDEKKFNFDDSDGFQYY